MSSLIINGSTTRFVRAGRSNMALPIFAILIFMFANALTLPVTARIVVGGFLLLTMVIGLRMYLTTLARVELLDDRIRILLAACNREIPYNTIESVQVVRLRLTPLLRIRIKSRPPRRIVQFLIPGPFTPWGSLADCSARLVGELRFKGLQVTEK